MSEMFNYPWILCGAAIFFISMLLLRELVIAWHLPSGHPERGISCFNACILFATVLAGLFGTHFLYMHTRALARIVPMYPLVRYAPEREVFSSGAFGKTWIFVAADAPSAIVDFYQTHASPDTYTLVRDESAVTPRLLFTKEGGNLFLTIVPEGNKSVLYYSRDGTMALVKTH